jgi:hypothetical protein
MKYLELYLAFTNLDKKLHAKSITSLHLATLDNIAVETLFLDYTYFNRRLSAKENKMVKLKAAKQIGYPDVINIGDIKDNYLYLAETWKDGTCTQLIGPDSLPTNIMGYRTVYDLKFPIVKSTLYYGLKKVTDKVEPFKNQHFFAKLYHENEKFFTKAVVQSKWVTDSTVILYLKSNFMDYKKLDDYMKKDYVKVYKQLDGVQLQVQFVTTEEYLRCHPLSNKE